MPPVSFLYLKDIATHLQSQGWTKAAALPLDELLAELPDDIRAKLLMAQWVESATCPTVATLLEGPLYAAEIRRRFGIAGEMALAKWVAAWLGRKSRRPPQPAAAKTKPAAASGLGNGSASPLKIGMTVKALNEWSRADPLRRVVRRITLGELVLPPEVTASGRIYLPSYETLEGILTTGAQRSYYAPPEPLMAFVLKLFQLTERADEIAVLQERDMLALPPPADPELAILRQLLLDLRERIRPFAKPRCDLLLRTAVVEVQPEERTLWMRDPDAAEFCPHHDWSHVVLALTSEGGQFLTAATCKFQCAVGLAAVDAALRWATQVKPSKDLQQLAHNLAVPQWQLAVEKIDEVLAAQTKVEGLTEQEELGWRLGLLGSQWELEPVWVGTTRKGQPRIKKANLKELRNNLLACTRPSDQKLVELLRPNPGLPFNLWQQPDAPRLLGRALQLLVGHPYVWDRAADRPIAVRQLPLKVALVEVPEGAQWQVQVGEEACTPQSLLARLAEGAEHALLQSEAQVVVVPVSQLQANLLRALGQAPMVPMQALPTLMQRVPAMARMVGLDVPDRLRGKQVQASAKAMVRVDPLPDGSLGVEPLVRPLATGSLMVPGLGHQHVYGMDGEQRIWAERDLELEKRNFDQIWIFANLSPEEPYAPQVLPGDRGLDLLAALADNEQLVETLWTKTKRQVRHAGVKQLRIEVTEKTDWFGVSGGLKVEEGQVDLAAVLEAIRGKRKYVRVSGDLWLQISDALRAHLEPVADAVAATKQGLVISPLQIEALADVVEPPKSDRWHHALARMKEAQGLAFPVPQGLVAELRAYQTDGYSWLARLAHWSPGALLADDMGLGKTLQALALLLHRRDDGPALVVAPTSVESNWLREAERFAPGLRFRAWRQGDRQDHDRVTAGDVIVISYDLLVRDVEPLSTVLWATLVLDEAQSVKNATTQRWKSVGKLKADFRLGLTGTPVENHIGELWAVLAATVPGLLGPWQLFQERYGVSIERDHKDDALKALTRVLKPFVLRRLKTEVARDLPARIEIRVDVTPSPAEHELYEQVRLASLAEIQGSQAADPQQQRFKVLAAITRLRQVACNPRLFDEGSPLPSAKLDHVIELLQELREEGHRALVFSQFVRHLALVRERLDQAGLTYRYLDGSTPEPQRRKEVQAFQEGSGDVFLISLKAGGTGLNLTAADYVFHLDPWWNPAVEDQATDRAHRIGQLRPVTVYKIVAKGTIEEAILDLQGRKRELVANLLSGTGDGPQLSTEELMGLLAR